VTSPWAVVTATPADAPGVIALIARVYAEYGFLWDPMVEVPDLLDFARYQAPGGAFFVVRDGDVVVGSVGVERVDETTAEVHRLYLDVALRGRGTGRALMEAAIGWCRAGGLRRVTLWSDTRFETAHRLYVAMGFRRGPERVLPDDPNDTREYFFDRAV
jgi:putative acetyltransferase